MPPSTQGRGSTGSNSWPRGIYYRNRPSKDVTGMRRVSVLSLVLIFWEGKNRTAGYLSIIMMMAGDVEKNPGPEECEGCRGSIKVSQVPMKCRQCGKGYHACCTGVKRAMWEKFKKGDKEWNCRKCVGEQTREEEDNGIQWQREMDERRRAGSKCAVCNKKMREARILVVCSECERMFHQKCSGLTKTRIEKEAKIGKWRCEDCKRGRDGEVDERERETEDVEGEKRETMEVGEGKRFRIVQWNVDGISNKEEEIRDRLKEWKAEVVAIQETKLKEGDRTPMFAGYTGLRKDRKYVRKDNDRRGGGLLMLIKKEVPYRKKSGWRGKTTEGQVVKVWLNQTEKLVITNVYRPPIRRIEGEDEREPDLVRSWLRDERNGVLVGDFNLHDGKWSRIRRRDPEARELISWCEETNYKILNDGEDTRKDRGGREDGAPDLTIVSKELEERCKWKVLERESSDHFPIQTDIRGERKVRRKRVILSWAWKKANWEAYRKKMKERSREKILEGKLGDKVDKLTRMIVKTAEECIPKKRAKSSNKPFWDDEMTNLRNRRNAIKGKTEDEREERRRVDDELKVRISEKKKEFWREFVEGMNEHTSSSKMWKTIKVMKDGRKDDRNNEVMVADGKELKTDKEKAKSFMRQYEEVSNSKLNMEERKQKVMIKERLKRYEKEGAFDEEFGMEELERALNQIGEKKKGGWDEVEPAMMKRLPKETKVQLLGLFNESWREGKVPGQWKKAVIIPIQKEGKEPGQRESYRPVSLTPVMVKLLERMVVNRTYGWMEKEGVIREWQSGFQRLRSTEEQIIRLAQDIQDGMERKERTVALALDCSKAYDRVWRTRLLERMIEEGMPKRMIMWYKSFLEDRKARVRVGGDVSEWRKMRQGLPQGAVSSPVLFLLYANDWEGYQVEGVEYSGYADDICIWTSRKTVEEARSILEVAAGRVSEWAKRNRIEINPLKSEAAMFTNSNVDKRKKMLIQVEGKEIHVGKEMAFLGVNMECNMTFGKQEKQVVKKVKERANILSALAGKNWGMRKEELRKVYKTMVESNIWYGASGWMPWLSESGMDRVERAQREALRRVTGLHQSTPIEYLYKESGVETVRTQEMRRRIVSYERAMRMQEGNPLRRVAERRVTKRLKTKKGWREQAKKDSERILGPDYLREEFSTKRAGPEVKLGNIRLEEMDMRKGGEEAERLEKKKEVERLLRDEGCDMNIYTDGSVEGGVDGGGAACVMRSGEEWEVKREATGKWSSSYRSEMVALRMAVEMILEKKPHTVVIWTDSKAVLSSLRANRNSSNVLYEEVKRKLSEAGSMSRVVVRWIPGHIGVEGNEEADREANKAREGSQREIELDINVAESVVRRAVKDKECTEGRYRRVYGGKAVKGNLSREEEVLLGQLRSGHCARTKYYKKRIGEEENARCEDCGDEEEKDHVWECDRWKSTRERMDIFGIEVMSEEERAVNYLRKVKPQWFDP